MTNPMPESLSNFLAWKAPHIQQLIYGNILVPQGKIVIFGPYKSWKSMTAIDLGFKLSTGKPWLGFNTTLASVLIVQLEIPKFAYQKRVNKYAIGNHLNPASNLHFMTVRNLKIDRGWGKELLSQYIQHTQAQVVIIDPLYKVVSGRLTDEYDIRQAIDAIDEIIDKYRVSVILIHHEGKDWVIDGERYDRGADASFGSAVIGWWVDSAIELRTETEGSNIVNVRFPLLRLAEEDIPDLVMKVNKSNLVFTRIGQKAREYEEETNDSQT